MSLLNITDKVINFNKANKAFDYTYMYSDCGSTYRAGVKQHEEITKLYSELNDDEKDLVGLYHNYILNRSFKGQFHYPVTGVPDTREEAEKYFK